MNDWIEFLSALEEPRQSEMLWHKKGHKNGTVPYGSTLHKKTMSLCVSYARYAMAHRF